MNLDLKEIKALIRMLDETDVAEISLESDGVKIHIRKASAFAGSKGGTAEGLDLSERSELRAPATTEDGVASAVSTEVESAEAAVPSHWQEVCAPVVGTFYRAPAPDAAPYVDVGDRVQEGQTLCIVEAMKLMNEIPSEGGGQIKQILVDDGTSVEYGQPLFLVEPN